METIHTETTKVIQIYPRKHQFVPELISRPHVPTLLDDRGDRMETL